MVKKLMFSLLAVVTICLGSGFMVGCSTTSTPEEKLERVGGVIDIAAEVLEIYAVLRPAESPLIAIDTVDTALIESLENQAAEKFKESETAEDKATYRRAMIRLDQINSSLIEATAPD